MFTRWGCSSIFSVLLMRWSWKCSQGTAAAVLLLHTCNDVIIATQNGFRTHIFEALQQQQLLQTLVWMTPFVTMWFKCCVIKSAAAATPCERTFNMSLCLCIVYCFFVKREYECGVIHKWNSVFSPGDRSGRNPKDAILLFGQFFTNIEWKWKKWALSHH